MSSSTSPQALAGTLRSFVHDRCVAAMERYFPSLRVPRTFGGYRITTDFAVDFIYTLKFLYKAGITQLRGRPIVEIIRPILLQVDGKATTTFYSYRIAEVLLAFGGFNQENPLLAGMTAGQMDNLAEAVDSSGIFDPKKKDLRGFANNYWAVMGRCEFDRRELGLLRDDTLLNLCVTKVSAALAGNPQGFFDDSTDRSSRFDIYSFDTHLFLEPLWPLLDQEILQRNMRRHAEMLDQIVMPNGAAVAWGRSVGAMSVMMTAEFGALALRDGLTANPARTLALVQYAFDKFRTEWFADDLINAHQYKMTFNYRGPQRLMQMTFDLMYKLAWAADALAAAPAGDLPAVKKEALFPAKDVFMDFREASSSPRAGVWIFRNNALDFQLAAVGGANADYAAMPRSPGLFENPVDSFLVCGVPRVWVKPAQETKDNPFGAATPEIEFIPSGAPASVTKTPNALALTYDVFSRAAGREEPQTLDGKRTVAYKVDGDTIHVAETWEFKEVPAAIGLSIPETVSRPLLVDFQSQNEYSKSIVSVKGMQFWRSFWGEMARVHQIDFAPAKEIHLTYTITPVLKMAQGPTMHDYNRSFYDHVTPGLIKEIPIGNAVCGYLMNARLFAQDADIVHFGWPEHLYTPHGMPEKDFDEKLMAFFHDIKKLGKKIVWTMHNRRPHAWAKARGIAMYRELAALTDGCFHHSRWGEKIMRADYQFPKHCKHFVIPHPHFAAVMKTPLSRQELEAKYKLPPTKLRVGLLGRYQPEKQIEMILAAFAAAGRTDLQLVYNTHRELPVPAPVNPPVASNIFRLERPQWMDRWQIAEHTKLCDLMVAAHTGDTYLTSGLSADSMGAGIPILVPHWEFFHETLGDAALYHDNTQASLTEVFRTLTPETVGAAREKTVALMPQYAPEKLGPQLARALREVRLAEPAA